MNKRILILTLGAIMFFLLGSLSIYAISFSATHTEIVGCVDGQNRVNLAGIECKGEYYTIGSFPREDYNLIAFSLALITVISYFTVLVTVFELSNEISDQRRKR